MAVVLSATACRGSDQTVITAVISAVPSRDAGAATDVGSVAPDSGRGLGFEGPCGPGYVAAYPAFDTDGAPREAAARATARWFAVEALAEFAAQLGDRVDAGARFAEGEVAERARSLLTNREGELDDRVLPALLAGAEPVQRTLGELSPGVSLQDGVSALAPARAQLDDIFATLAENASNRALGFLRRGPGLSLLPLHVTRDGRDLSAQLRGALTASAIWSRAAGELLAPESLAARARDQGVEGLIRDWDEALSSFGAARDHDRYAPREVVGAGGRESYRHGWHDTDADCRIDRVAEENRGYAVLAAARDVESGALAGLGERTFSALLRGRSLLESGGTGVDSLEGLEEQAALAIGAWEEVLAATALVVARELIEVTELGREGLADYSFTEHARVWSELDGLVASFRLNPRTRLGSERHAQLRALVGDAPVVPNQLPPTNAEQLSRYVERVGEARELIAESYGFDAALVDSW